MLLSCSVDAVFIMIGFDRVLDSDLVLIFSQYPLLLSTLLSTHYEKQSRNRNLSIYTSVDEPLSDIL